MSVKNNVLNRLEALCCRSKRSSISSIAALAMLVTSITLATLSGRADAVENSLSIKEAVSRALEHHSEIKIQKQKKQKIVEQKREATSMALPQVGGQIQWMTYPVAPVLQADLGMGEMEIPMKGKFELKASATLTQTIWAFGKVFTAIDIATQSLELEDISMDSKRDDIAYDTRVLYYSALMAKESLKIAEASYKNAITNRSELKSRFSGGRLGRYENIKMASDIASRKPIVLDAKTQYDLSLKALKKQISMKKTDDISLRTAFTENFPSYTLAELRNTLQGEQPKLKALEKAILLNANYVKLQKSMFYPTIAGFVAYEYSGTSNKALVGTNFLNHTLLAGITIDFTLWDSFATSGRVGQALAERRITEITLEQTKKDLDLALVATLEEFNSLKETYKANLDALRLAKEAYKSSRLGFRAGKLSETQLNDAEFMQTNARISTKATLYKINLAMARILQLTSEEAK